MTSDVVYLNARVWATLKPSSLGGVGVFAIRDIEKGTRITDYTISSPKKRVCAISTAMLPFVVEEVRSLILDRMMFQDGNDIFYFVSPNCDACLRSFMNHSRTPNTDGVVATRDIKKGEEITEDYTSFYKMHDLSREHYKDFL